MTQLSEPREHAVRAELNRILESPAFRTSRRCREFLQYIVDRTLKSAGDALKERSIGVELFELAPDFDTSQHTIVRVTANEVRKKLAQHYLADNGACQQVRIELPPGSFDARITPASAAISLMRWATRSWPLATTVGAVMVDESHCSAMAK